jgi:hypothetical protein
MHYQGNSTSSGHRRRCIGRGGGWAGRWRKATCISPSLESLLSVSLFSHNQAGEQQPSGLTLMRYAVCLLMPCLRYHLRATGGGRDSGGDVSHWFFFFFFTRNKLARNCRTWSVPHSSVQDKRSS